MRRSDGVVRLGRAVHAAIVMFVTVLFVTASVSVSATPAGDTLAKEADQLVRNAERNMFNGKIDEAVQLLEEAAAKIEQLKSVDPDNRRLSSVESKYNRIKKQVDRKVTQRGYQSTSAASKTPVPKSAGTKLPAGVSKRLGDITRLLDQAESYAGTDAGKAKYKLSQAESLFGEIDRMYGTQFDKNNPEYSAVRSRFDQVGSAADQQASAEQKARVDAQASDAAREKQSAEWIPRFQAYLSYEGMEGHDPDKLVFVPGTSQPEKFAEAQRRYDAFKAFYSEYKKIEFPYGRSWKLENLADKEAPERLAFFEERFADRLSSVAGDAEKQIRDAMAQLQKDNGWKSDKSVKPPIIDSNWMTAIGESVSRAVSGLGDNPKAASIQRDYEQLRDADKKNRQIRAERTFLSPDVYDGSDADQLKKTVRAIVEKARPGSRIYQIAIYQADWKEDTVKEWTDSTHTKWRIRTTRQINAQVAAEDGSGVYMHTVHLARDKQSGGWGALYGHIMFSDPMARDNVDR